MQVQSRQPLNDKSDSIKEECEYLETNFLRCLKEKSAKDEVPKMTCKVENILWFILECPKRFSEYESDEGLRRIYKQVKLNPNNPLPTKVTRRDS